MPLLSREVICQLFPSTRFSNSVVPSEGKKSRVCIQSEEPVPLTPRPTTMARSIELKRALVAEKAMKSGPAISEHNILYEDDWMLIINKPPGIYSGHVLVSIPYLWGHPYSSKYPLEDRKLQKPGRSLIEPHLHLANRLDRDTSGVMVITKCKIAAGKLVKTFTRRLIKKSYVALCTGSLPDWTTITIESGHGRSEHGSWHVYCKKDVGRRLVGGSVVKDMVTQFTILGHARYSPSCRCMTSIMNRSTKRLIAGDSETQTFDYQKHVTTHSSMGENGLDEILLRSFPLTGRTHQVRLHCQFLDLPLKGDVKYGGVVYFNGIHNNCHALHAETLDFEHPITSKQIQISAPLPKWGDDFRTIPCFPER